MSSEAFRFPYHDVLSAFVHADGRQNDTAAIQSAIDECSVAGGGRVVLPSGQFLCGFLELKSNVDLHLSPGAVLLSSPNISDYETEHDTRGLLFLLYAIDAENISITGGGTIDGNGRAFIEKGPAHIHLKKGPRPFTVGIVGCRNVTMKDIKIVDAAHWTVTLVGCDDALIHGIRIVNDMLMPNSDGIDLERCRNVRISDCHIEAGDDCIVFKTNRRWDGYGPCENVTVTGCTMVSNSFAVNMGCEVQEPIRNIVVDSCVIRSSHRGVGIHLSEASDVENIVFSNLIIETRYRHPDWWGAAEPIYIVALPWTENDTVGTVRHIRFTNILCRGENGVFVLGEDESTIDDVVFDNVRVELDKWTDEPGGRHDIRPCAGDDNGRESGVYDHPSAGFYLQNARNITIRNCGVFWGDNRPDYYRYALESHRVTNLVLDHFTGEAAHPERDSPTVID